MLRLHWATSVRLALLVPILVIGLEVPCFAQLPLIRLDHTFPLGAEAGSTILLEISGKDLDGVTELRFDYPGFKAEPTKPGEFRVTIASDTPRGTHEFRGVGKHGISGSRLLMLDRGLAEIRKAGHADSVGSAQAVPLNAAINGRTDANAADCYRVSLAKGQRVTIDCWAFRLDSNMRAVMSLGTPEGVELQRGMAAHDRVDPFIDFVALEAGDYILTIHDLTYGGGLPYRIVLGDRPSIELAFPPAVETRKIGEVQLMGHHLPAGKSVEAEGLELTGIEQARLSVEVPRTLDGPRRDGLGDLLHLPSCSLLVRGVQLWPVDWPESLYPLKLMEVDGPVTLEREPDDSTAETQTLTPPATVCGRFDRPGDVDVYTFKGRAGEVVAVDLVCERMQRPGDPVVVVSDARGRELAVLDDQGSNFNALTQMNRDPAGLVTLPEDGTYRITVIERFGKGGPRYAYVLRLGPPRPDFAPVLCHENNDPSCPLVRQGGSAFFEVTVNRREGFDGPVTIEAHGLPRGVSCPPIVIGPRADQAALVFTAEPDAPEWSGMITVTASAVIDGRPVEREVACVQRRWGESVNDRPNLDNVSRVCRRIGLAVRPRAPYGMSLIRSTSNVQAAAGATLTAKVVVRRQWPELQGPIVLTGLLLPPGFELLAAEVPAKASEASVRVSIAEDVAAGRYTLTLRGEAMVPFSTDPAVPVSERPLVRAACPATPLIVDVTGRSAELKRSAGAGTPAPKGG
jgi:hypothetical protein